MQEYGRDGKKRDTDKHQGKNNVEEDRSEQHSDPELDQRNLGRWRSQEQRRDTLDRLAKVTSSPEDSEEEEEEEEEEEDSEDNEELGQSKNPRIQSPTQEYGERSRPVSTTPEPATPGLSASAESFPVLTTMTGRVQDWEAQMRPRMEAKEATIKSVVERMDMLQKTVVKGHTRSQARWPRNYRGS